MTKMDQVNTTEHTTVESTAEIAESEGLPLAIITEIKRLQSEHLDNTTLLGHSLLFNHTKCDSEYLNEMLGEFGPEFPTLDTGCSDKTSSGSDNQLPETNLTRVAAFVEDELIPTRNECAIQGNSIGLGAEFVAKLNHLQRQQDVILINNSDLKSQVMQQQAMIVDLQRNNLEQHEVILELRKQLNVLTEMHRLDFQTSADERLKAQQITEIDQQPADKLGDRPPTEVGTVMTNEQPQTNFSIECAQSSTENDTDPQSYSEEVEQSEHDAPSLQEEGNINQSHGSLKIKQVRSVQTRRGHGKRIKFNLENIEESPTYVRNSRQQRKSYTCGECKKQFNHKHVFTRHLRIHTGEKPYVCKECGVAFSQGGNLKKHQRIHSGKKPYLCKECGVAFSQGGNLKKHQIIHSGEKPFICDICKKSFGRNYNLKAHMNIHSGKTSYKCNECQKEFHHRSTLRTHRRTHS